MLLVQTLRCTVLFYSTGTRTWARPGLGSSFSLKYLSSLILLSIRFKFIVSLWTVRLTPPCIYCTFYSSTSNCTVFHLYGLLCSRVQTCAPCTRRRVTLHCSPRDSSPMFDKQLDWTRMNPLAIVRELRHNQSASSSTNPQYHLESIFSMCILVLYYVLTVQYCTSVQVKKGEQIL